MEKCWCGNINLQKFIHPDYKECPECTALVSTKTVQDVSKFYDFQDYWHTRQTKDLHNPEIERRSTSDFHDRIPKWIETIKELSPERGSILEVGCCHGGFLYQCQLEGFRRVVGVEVSKGTCEFAKTRFGLEEIICGVFPDVQIDGHFDFVVGFDVLEHFLDPLAAVQSMVNYLKPNGVLILQTPWYRGEGLRFRHYYPEEHLYIFNVLSITELFKRVGLTVDICKPGVFIQDMTICGRKNG
jgi:2-polyprenyl-3-methyl-5-hydroxy-6-metoxy-1,4-benzoquinol methylase